MVYSFRMCRVGAPPAYWICRWPVRRARGSHLSRALLRGLGPRVLELGGESGTDAEPLVFPGTYVEYVARTGHEAPGTHS